MTQRTILLGFLLFIIAQSGCKKNDDLPPEKQILGVWVSTSTEDILNFTDEDTFYKSNKNIHDDPYRYVLEKDSIEIQYSGESLIAMPPTKHKYSLNGSRLTIDFASNHCFGFPTELLTFVKR